jgi:hypothetical protein
MALLSGCVARRRCRWAKFHHWLARSALAAAVIGCRAAPAAPPAPPPAPVAIAPRVPPRSTDREWIDSVSREIRFAGPASTEDVAPSVSREKPTRPLSGSTIESTQAADVAEPSTGSVGAASPAAYADDTRPRMLLAGIGLLSLITLIALTRRS